MEEFQTLYQNYLQNPRPKSDENATLFHRALKLVLGIKSRDEQIACLENLIFLFPDKYILYHHMGNIYNPSSGQGSAIQVQKALLWYKICYRLKPDFLENIVPLIKLLFENGMTQAVFHLNIRGLFDQFMNDRRFLTIYARCHLQLLHYSNGVENLLKLIELNRELVPTTHEEKRSIWSNYHDIGYIYSAMGDIPNSMKYTRIATQLANQYRLSLNDRLLSFQNVVSYAEFEYCTPNTTEYMPSSQDELFQLYRQINDYVPQQKPFMFSRRPRTTPLIHVGYVSSDFVMHAISNFLLPILRHFDRSRFAITLFSNNGTVNPIYRDLGIPIVGIHSLSDRDAAQLIYDRGVDILIDLNGHTVGNRLGVFSWNPAPVQVTYLGYPNTTGLEGIRYRITDAVADLPASKQPYSETLVRLPCCFLLYKSIHQESPVFPRPSDSTVVLGAVNKENKNSCHVLTLWKRILCACPHTKILVKLESFDNMEERGAYYRRVLEIDASRLILLPKLANEMYIRLFGMIDVLLDTFPYSGTTTSCNALFNSLPIVTLQHPDYHAHNVTASILTHLGAGELVAHSQDEYVEKVCSLVHSRDRLDHYKRSLGLMFSKMMDPKRFMPHYEEALRDMFSKI